MFVVLTVCLVLGHTGRPQKGAALVFTEIERWHRHLSAVRVAYDNAGPTAGARLRYVVDFQERHTFEVVLASHLHRVGAGRKRDK
jgi:hypothetical protein